MNYRKKVIQEFAVLSICLLLNPMSEAAFADAMPTPKAQLIVDPAIASTPTPTIEPSTQIENGIAIPGWASIRMPYGKEKVALSLYNPESNSVYLTFELKLETTGETIFSTGLIPPGMHCTSVNIKHELEPGEYACMMYVQPYTMEEEPQQTHNAVMQTRLYVNSSE